MEAPTVFGEEAMALQQAPLFSLLSQPAPQELGLPRTFGVPTIPIAGLQPGATGVLRFPPPSTVPRFREETEEVVGTEERRMVRPRRGKRTAARAGIRPGPEEAVPAVGAAAGLGLGGEGAEAAVAILETEMDNLQAQFDRALGMAEASQTANDALRAQAERANANVQRLQERVVQSEAEVDRLQEELDAALQDLQNELLTAERYRGSAQDLRGEIARLTAQIARGEESLTSDQERLAAASRQSALLSGRIARVTDSIRTSALAISEAGALEDRFVQSMTRLGRRLGPTTGVYASRHPDDFASGALASTVSRFAGPAFVMLAMAGMPPTRADTGTTERASSAQMAVGLGPPEEEEEETRTPVASPFPLCSLGPDALAAAFDEWSDAMGSWVNEEVARLADAQAAESRNASRRADVLAVSAETLSGAGGRLREPMRIAERNERAVAEADAEAATQTEQDIESGMYAAPYRTPGYQAALEFMQVASCMLDASSGDPYISPPGESRTFGRLRIRTSPAAVLEYNRRLADGGWTAAPSDATNVFAAQAIARAVRELWQRVREYAVNVSDGEGDASGAQDALADLYGAMGDYPPPPPLPASETEQRGGARKGPERAAAEADFKEAVGAAEDAGDVALALLQRQFARALAADAARLLAVLNAQGVTPPTAYTGGAASVVCQALADASQNGIGLPAGIRGPCETLTQEAGLLGFAPEGRTQGHAGGDVDRAARDVALLFREMVSNVVKPPWKTTEFASSRTGGGK